MNRSRSKNKYLKNRTVDNWERYQQLRNKCVKLTKKVKTDYFKNINIQSIIDNKKIWKTVKPNFSNKIKTENIILLDDGKIISENTKIAEVFNDYFINIVKDLQITDIILAEVPVIPQNINDPIDNILYTYLNHPSIIKIRIHVDQAEKFSFSNATEKQIETEINKLNPKKAPGADGIPTNILKEFVDILKSPLHKL